MHPRKNIRHKAVELLKAGVDVGDRVYPQRPDPVFETEYPLVFTYFINDGVDAVNNAQDTYDRRITLNVDVVHDVRKDIDDILDGLAWEAFVALLQDTRWGDLIKNIKLIGETPYQNNIDGEQYRGVTRMQFEIEYDMQVYVPNATDEFKKFGKEIDAPIGDGAVAEIDQTIRT
jgi:hypothetical protein